MVSDGLGTECSVAHFNERSLRSRVRQRLLHILSALNLEVAASFFSSDIAQAHAHTVRCSTESQRLLLHIHMQGPLNGEA
jgi:hypothetical protein